MHTQMLVLTLEGHIVDPNYPAAASCLKIFHLPHCPSMYIKIRPGYSTRHLSLISNLFSNCLVSVKSFEIPDFQSL